MPVGEGAGSWRLYQARQSRGLRRLARSLEPGRWRGGGGSSLWLLFLACVAGGHSTVGHPSLGSEPLSRAPRGSQAVTRLELGFWSPVPNLQPHGFPVSRRSWLPQSHNGAENCNRTTRGPEKAVKAPPSCPDSVPGGCFLGYLRTCSSLVWPGTVESSLLCTSVLSPVFLNGGVGGVGVKR